jgi:hypothetical protein
MKSKKSADKTNINIFIENFTHISIDPKTLYGSDIQ